MFNSFSNRLIIRIDVLVLDSGVHGVTHYRTAVDADWIAIHDNMPSEPAYLKTESGLIYKDNGGDVHDAKRSGDHRVPKWVVELLVADARRGA